MHSEFCTMDEESIVPDVIDVVPPDVLEVSYSGGKVDLGKELTPTQVKDEPTVSWEADSDSLYTLCMTDPDVPNRKSPKFSVVHWLVVNIPGNNVKDGQVVTEYLGSGPRPGSGLHRYVFLLYKQSAKITVGDETIQSKQLDGRFNFSARKFALKHDLGQPVAGNFYQAQYDDYVPILQSLMK